MRRRYQRHHPSQHRPSGRTSILIAHRGLLTQRDEVADLTESIAGAVEAGLPPDVDVELSDGRFRYRPTVQHGDLEPVPIGRLSWRRGRYDIALVHEPIPLIHLALAAALRRRGTFVVHQPINMLSESYRRQAWFAPRSWFYRRLRPLLVSTTALGWRIVADGFLCVSQREVDDSPFPADRCRVLRWPRPPTGLAAATFAPSATGPAAPADAPIAFVNRFDWHRKGFDRLCAWLEANGDGESLPRPAVLLCAPEPPPSDVPDRLRRLVDDGLIEWNTAASGPSLYPELMRCRGLLLLSRYDGQSRVLREAALAGLPTISTIDSHFTELIADLGCGAIADGDDPADVQRAFDAIAGQTASIDVARKVFDRQPIGAELIELLAEMGRP